MPNDDYWDSCLFIEAVQKTDPARLDCLIDLIHKAKRKELRIITSAYTITEVNKLDDLAKVSGTLRDEQSRMILSFFENQYIYIRPVTRQVAELAHGFTCSHGLKNADAIHVATAILAKVTVLYTWDGSGKQRRGKLLPYNLKIGTPPLRIEVPPDPDKGTLYDKKHAPSA
jgi:predicted nucleic acid-binding protein